MKLCLNRPAKQYLFLSFFDCKDLEVQRSCEMCWEVEVAGSEPAQPNGTGLGCLYILLQKYL